MRTETFIALLFRYFWLMLLLTIALIGIVAMKQYGQYQIYVRLHIRFSTSTQHKGERSLPHAASAQASQNSWGIATDRLSILDFFPKPDRPSLTVSTQTSWDWVGTAQSPLNHRHPQTFWDSLSQPTFCNRECKM